MKISIKRCVHAAVIASMTTLACGISATVSAETMCADLSVFAEGTSLEGLNTVVPGLEIKNLSATGSIVKIIEGGTQAAYGAGPASDIRNGGLAIGGGFSNVVRANANLVHQYAFLFPDGVSRFELRMLDFGDFNPTRAKFHEATMTAYDADGAEVDSAALSYTSDGLINPLTSVPYGQLFSNIFPAAGDALGGKEPGVWEWEVQSILAGIEKIELKFPAGMDPKIGFDSLCFAQCWEDETAWSDGLRYVTRGNWATYTEVNSYPKTVTLYAAQNLEAGTVEFKVNVEGDSTDIIITLNDGFRFAVDEDENLKIQGYDEAPSGNPSPGGFAFKSTESGKSATVTVPYFQFYGVHVDVEVRVDCPVECKSEYLLEVASVNGNDSFSHSFALTLDSEGELTGTGYSNYHQWEETLSDFDYLLNTDGEITYVSFKAVYPNGYTWYPAFELIGGGSLLFVEVNGPDNVNSATGTWTTKEECVAN